MKATVDDKKKDLYAVASAIVKYIEKTEGIELNENRK